jgi:UDP-3-O-[3-hydroxymyristoyl] glucosamine N-acyltransferase
MNQKASDVFDAFRQQGVLTAMSGEDTDLTGIASVETCGPGDLVFVDRGTSVPLVLSNRPSAVVTSENLQHAFDGHDRVTVLVAPNVKLAQALLRQMYADRDLRDTEWPAIHPSAVIHESASLGEGTVVGPAVVVGADVRIGERCAIMAGTVIERGAVLGNDVVIHPNVTVGYECEIGDEAILHSGSVIGCEGYSFAQDANGRSHRLPQTGKVVIEERVRVGANNCIDRAAFGETRIGAGTKMDNLCHVAHNVTLGRDCLLTAGFIIAGSVNIGDRLLATGTSWISDHLTLCDDVALVHRAGVTRDIVRPGAYAGTPAVPLADHMKTVALTRKLGDTRSRLIALEKEVETLRKQVGNGPSGRD